MHPKSTASPVAGQPATNLQLERLWNGELGWLRPATEPALRVYVLSSRPVLTDLGRRSFATAALFGPWPTVVQATRAVIPMNDTRADSVRHCSRR